MKYALMHAPKNPSGAQKCVRAPMTGMAIVRGAVDVQLMEDTLVEGGAVHAAER